MPLQNFHAARLSDPDSYDSYGYTHGGNLYGGKLKVLSTIDIVWGHPKGGPKAAAVPQSLRFPKAEWTEKEAKAWLKDNNVKNIGFEPAKEGDESARPIHRRFRGTNTAVNLAEQFFSLQQALNWAVQDRFGANTYVADFSDTEVMFRPDPGPVGVSVPQMPSDEYLKLSYAIEDGEVVLGDEEPEVVYRRSVYEPVDTEEMIQLTVRENQLKELAWKVHATHDKKGSKSFTVSAKSSKHAWAKAKSQCSSSGHKVLSVKAESIEEGGQGSGNFGHAGRAGEVGGSGAGGGEGRSAGRSLAAGRGAPEADAAGLKQALGGSGDNYEKHLDIMNKWAEGQATEVGQVDDNDEDAPIQAARIMKRQCKKLGLTMKYFTGGGDMMSAEITGPGKSGKSIKVQFGSAFDEGANDLVDAFDQALSKFGMEVKFPPIEGADDFYSTSSPLWAVGKKGGGKSKGLLAREAKEAASLARWKASQANKKESILLLAAKVARVRAVTEGGSGSGNFGHAGRPGEIGGSGGGGSDKTPHGNLQGSGLSYVQPLSKKASKQYAKQVDKLQGTLGRLWTRAKTVAREKGTQVNPSTDKYAHRYYKAKAMVFRQKPYNKGKWGLWSEATAAKVARVRAMVEGGSGSGNYGHAGRPGEVGGSGAGGTGGKEWTSYKAHPSKGTFVKRVSGKPSLGATSYQPDMAKGIFTKSTVSKGQADREKLLKKLEKMPAKYWSKKVLSTSALRQRGAPDFVLHKGKTYFRKGQAGKGNAFIIKKGITYFSRSKDKMATYQQKKGSAKYTFIGMKKSKNEMSLSDKVARVRGIVAAIGGAS